MLKHTLLTAMELGIPSEKRSSIAAVNLRRRSSAYHSLQRFKVRLRRSNSLSWPNSEVLTRNLAFRAFRALLEFCVYLFGLIQFRFVRRLTIQISSRIGEYKIHR